MANARAIIWTDAAEVAIPESPALLTDSSCLWLAYETTVEPRRRMHTVVRFDGLIDHRLSPINDEGLGHHPYACAGLQWYAFNEILDSAETIRWRALKARHWVITFKDNTLDVLAEKAEVVVRAIDADSSLSALMSAAGGLTSRSS